jgi:hypothetical protein
MVTHARIAGSNRSMRDRQASISSTGESFFLAIRSEASAIVR